MISADFSPATNSDTSLTSADTSIFPTTKQNCSNQTQDSMNASAMCSLIAELSDPVLREHAIFELNRCREQFPDLAIYLWESPYTIISLIQEIISIYPFLNPPTLTTIQSNRVCSALSLFQSIASHQVTRIPFLRAYLPIYLYPFLQTSFKLKSFEYLRLTSLGVIGALVKNDDSEVVNFLLNSEMIPNCLSIMQSGSELSRTVATFILQKIMQDDNGLAYICQTFERFSHVAIVLGKLMLFLSNEPSTRILKPIIKCYARLSDDPRACRALKVCLPEQLKADDAIACVKDDPVCKKAFEQLKKNVRQSSQDPQIPIQKTLIKN